MVDGRKLPRSRWESMETKVRSTRSMDVAVQNRPRRRPVRRARADAGSFDGGRWHESGDVTSVPAPSSTRTRLMLEA